MHELFIVCKSEKAGQPKSPAKHAHERGYGSTDPSAACKRARASYLSSSSKTAVSAVFRSFLRSFDGYVLSETNTVTADRSTAEAAFAELVNRVYLDGQNWAAVLTYNQSQIALHRFDRSRGDADYWRDKLAVKAGRTPQAHGRRRTLQYLSRFCQPRNG
jgi:hypothetical protein